MAENANEEARVVRRACRVYQTLLRLYPGDFRHVFGGEMQIVFRDGCRDAFRSDGRRGVRAYWRRVVIDLVTTCCREQAAAVDRRPAALLLAGLGIGLGIGWLDFHASEVQGIVMLILASTGIFGGVSPRRAWRWALVIAGGVPLVHLVSAALHHTPPHPVEPNVFASLIALIPGMVGAYTGAFVRWAVAPLADGEGKV